MDLTVGAMPLPVNVVLLAPPQVSVYPRRHFSRPGSTVTLKCHSDGVPQPAISWQHNGQPLDGHSMSNDGATGHYVLLREFSRLTLKIWMSPLSLFREASVFVAPF